MNIPEKLKKFLEEGGVLEDRTTLDLGNDKKLVIIPVIKVTNKDKETGFYMGEITHQNQQYAVISA